MRRSKRNIRALTLTASLAAIISVMSVIYIPMYPVPITLQLFAVYFSLYIAGGGIGSASVLIYFFIGVLGLPVFSGLRGGIGAVFDVTGGFILGFVLLALVYWLLARLLPFRYGRLAATVVSLLSLYLFGTLWYSSVYLGGAGFWHSLTLTVLPFVIPDAIKIYLAYILARRLRSHIGFLKEQKI